MRRMGLTVVALGVGAAALAIGGALGALTSVVAMFLGILLHAHA